MVVALSKFGNFSNLEYMLSAPDDGNVTTMTFRNAIYTSQYISFVAVENEDRTHNILQSTNQTEQQLWDTYNQNAYPFMDIGGQYVVKSELYSYTDLNGLNWTQIGSQLNNPSSSVAKAIDGAANELVSAICKMDGHSPASVCGQSFANVAYVQPINGKSDSLAFDILRRNGLPSQDAILVSDMIDNGSRARFKLNGTGNCTAARTGEKWLNRAMKF